MPGDDNRPATLEDLWRSSICDSLRTLPIVVPDLHGWDPHRFIKPVVRNPLLEPRMHPLAIFGPQEPEPEPEPGPYTCTPVTMLPITIPNREEDE